MLDAMQWSNTMTKFGFPWQVQLSTSIIICGYHIGESLGVLALKFSSSLKPRFTYHTFFPQVGSALEETQRFLAKFFPALTLSNPSH